MGARHVLEEVKEGRPHSDVSELETPVEPSLNATVAVWFAWVAASVGFWCAALLVRSPRVIASVAIVDVASAVFLVLLGRRLDRVVLTIGADGVVAEKLATPVRVFPFASMHASRVVDGELEIEDRWGRRVLLRASRKSASVERIRDAIEDARERFTQATRPELVAALAIRHASPQARVEALRALGASGGASYREAVVDRAAIWRVLESPSAQADQRVAAMIALRVEATPEDVERLANVVAGVTDVGEERRLRVALEANDDETVAALFTVEEETAEPPPSTLPERLRARKRMTLR